MEWKINLPVVGPTIPTSIGTLEKEGYQDGSVNERRETLLTQHQGV
jgi:hypothetical protein